jgi:hypothetical protein
MDLQQKLRREPAQTDHSLSVFLGITNRWFEKSDSVGSFAQLIWDFLVDTRHCFLQLNHLSGKYTMIPLPSSDRSTPLVFTSQDHKVLSLLVETTYIVPCKIMAPETLEECTEKKEISAPVLESHSHDFGFPSTQPWNLNAARVRVTSRDRHYVGLLGGADPCCQERRTLQKKKGTGN